MHSAFYDYGIEIDQVAEMSFTQAPKIEIMGNYLFLLFHDKTVELETDTFRDVTPSFLKTHSLAFQVLMLIFPFQFHAFLRNMKQ